MKNSQYPDFVIDDAICYSIGSPDHLSHTAVRFIRYGPPGEREAPKPLDGDDDGQHDLRGSLAAIPGDEIMD